MLTDEIKKFFKGQVSTAAADLATASQDASVFEVKPEVVVRPLDVDDIKNLVKFAAKAKPTHPGLSLTARSGGTDMSGGPLNQSIIVDFTAHFNKVLGVDETSATTQPGVFYRDFEPETLKHDLLMPSYPASRSICTVGGMVANNSGGEKSLSYGQTKDYVEELHVVLSDGEEYVMGELNEAELDAKTKLNTFEGFVYKHMSQLIRDNYDVIKAAKPSTSKNSAGYFLWEVWNKEKKTFNLAKLITGSQGTLGLVTQIKFRLIHPKPRSELLVIFMNDLTDLAKLVHTVMRYGPESFESFDKHTYALAMKYLPGLIKAMKGNIIRLALEFLPELWLTLTGGIPQLALIAEFTGETNEEVFGKMKQAQAEVEKNFKVHTHITKNEHETQKYWVIRRESFNLLRQHTKGKHTAPFIDDIVVHVDQLPEFLPKLNAIFAKYPTLIYTIAGHAGDANFHIIPIMDLRQESERAIIPKLSNEVYDLVLQYKGSITAEHNEGLIRSPYTEKMFGEKVYGLFEQTKDIFDPQNIFNPGKKVRSSLPYALSHIKKT